MSGGMLGIAIVMIVTDAVGLTVTLLTAIFHGLRLALDRVEPGDGLRGEVERSVIAAVGLVVGVRDSVLSGRIGNIHEYDEEDTEQIEHGEGDRRKEEEKKREGEEEKR